MYVIRNGLGGRFRWLAGAYCAFGVIAAFGVGNATQTNAVITSMNTLLGYLGWQESRLGNLFMGVLLAMLIGRMLFGGAKRISQAAQKLVPFTAAVYILLCIGILLVKADAIPQAFSGIIEGAFSPRAVTGGVLGSAFRALRVGCSRGVFTNEAGMGTASIAHASAEVSHPAEQGLMGIMEVFLDTIVICTLTALAILVSGVPIPYGTDAGAVLTARAFEIVYGKAASIILALTLSCFAVATVLGWGLYGARCAQFLFGSKSWKGFAAVQTVMVALSAVLDTGTVWQISETVNGLMSIPNLIALAALTPELVRLTKDYKKSLTHAASAEVTYADFHQCKPL